MHSMSFFFRIKMLSVKDNNQLIENVEHLDKMDTGGKGRKLTRFVNKQIDKGELCLSHWHQHEPNQYTIPLIIWVYMDKEV